MNKKLGVLEALSAATPEELESLDREIVEIEKRLTALRAARQLVNVALNGKKPRKSPEKKEAKIAAVDGEHDEVREQMYELLKDEGFMPVPAIAARLKVSPPTIYKRAKHEWFVNVGGQIGIAKAG